MPRTHSLKWLVVGDKMEKLKDQFMKDLVNIGNWDFMLRAMASHQ